MIFGASFIVTILAIYVGKPAFCCTESKETSGVKEVKMGTAIGVAFSVGLIATGVAFMMQKSGAATPVSTMSPADKGFRFAFSNNTMSMPMAMDCGCGM